MSADSDSDLPRYWTREFVDELVESLNDSPSFQRTARSFSRTVVLRCLDTPDGKDCAASYTFEKGRCVAHQFEEEDAPSTAIRKAPFDKKKLFARTTAPYRIWLKLDRGEMNVAGALVSPDYVIEGSKLKIMRHIGVFTAMGDMAARQPKRY